MTSRVQLAFLVAVAVLAYSNAVPTTVDQRISTHKLVYYINLDKIFDDLRPNLVDFILQNGFDPLEIRDMSGSILPFMPGKLKGSLDLTNGWLQGISSVKRSNHITAIYTDQLLKLDMDLGFDVLDFSYNYHVKYLLAQRRGDVYGRFYNINIKVLLTIDVANRVVHVDSMKFASVGKYEITLEGHLLDPVLNLLNKALTVVFRKPILSLIEDRSFKSLHDMVEEWNAKYSPYIDYEKLIAKWISESNNIMPQVEHY